MQKTLDSLVQFAQVAGAEQGLTVSTQQINNQTVHTVQMMMLMLFQVTPSWVIVDDQFIFSLTTDECVAAMEKLSNPTAGQSIRTNPEFQKVTANMPDNLLTFSYTDSQEQFAGLASSIEQMWPTMIPALAMSAQINLPMDPPDMQPYIDMMEPTVSYRWMDANGIHHHIQGPGAEQVLMATATVGLGASIMMPALGRARELAKRVQCQSNLSVIGRTIAMYQSEFRDNNPAFLEDLVNISRLNPKALICPSSPIVEPGQSHYIYRGADLKGTAPGFMILAYDKFENHQGETRNVLFADYSVKRMTDEEDFQQAISRDNQQRLQMGLAEKIADK
ncbi:MAG: hypothetical protein GY869_25275 [Planctomycetes bacterium]|nr:hypothetical protein [Planctomycetota bacterium]